MLSNRIGWQSLDASTAHPSMAWLDERFGPEPPLAVFDFDGVLTSPVEDLAYRLPERPGERPLLDREARQHGIVPDIYDTRYLRHLVLQAALEGLGELPAKGPLLPLARELSRAKRPFFILTARSGRAAIARLMAYLQHHSLEPQEIFCVGRVPKGRQLALVGTSVRDGGLAVYFEDTVRHARNSSKQENALVATVHVSWTAPPWEEAEKLVSRVLHPRPEAAPLRSMA
jgi:hypothetical protein